MKEFPPFRLDTANQCLWRGDERILLTPKAFSVLRYLVEHAGRLVTQNELLEAVWPDTFVQPEVLKYQIADIRSILGDRPKSPLFIETLPRRGYQFIATVSEGEPAEPSASVIPARGRLIGRLRELSALQACLRRALSGQRQMVFITGEPGIGKTALVDEFQRQAAAEQPSLRIARGQCVEGFGGAEAYYPMLEALGRLCRGPGGNRVVEILAAHAPTWLVQFPALVKREQRQTLQQEILGATRDRMLREIREALDTLNLEAPLLLVFEDLQWVDPSTVDLISALARQRTTAKTVAVITKRPVDLVAPDHPLRKLKQDLLVHHLCQEITLAPLSVANVAEYLGAESQRDSLPEGFAELIHRHSEGNPMFMVAVLDHMNEHGQIRRENGKWRLGVPLEEVALDVPETLRQMIEAQIDRLTAEEQRALEAASVAGGLCSASVVAAATKMDTELLEELLARLSRRSHIVRAAGSRQLADGSILQGFEFVHALYREVFYHRQTPARRASLHRCIGDRLEELYLEREHEVAAELANHFEKACDWSRAIKYLVLAAETAQRRFEPRQASKILDRALDLTAKMPLAERGRRRTEVLAELAGIYRACADVRAIQMYQELDVTAADCGLIDVQSRSLTDLGFFLSYSNVRLSREAFDRALALSDKQSRTMQAVTRLVCHFWRTWIAGWNPQDVKECRRSLEVIQETCKGLELAQALLIYSLLLWASSEYLSAYQTAVEAVRLATDAGQQKPYQNFLHDFSRGLILPRSLLFAGRWGEALHEVQSALGEFERNGEQHWAESLQHTRTWIHLQAMDFVTAQRICQSVLSVTQLDTNAGRSPQSLLGLILGGTAAVGLGDFESAQQHFARARESMDGEMVSHDWYWRMVLQAGLTDLWLASGDPVRARQEAEEFLKVSMPTAERTFQALAWEASARVAKAELDLGRAQDCIGRAVSTMEGYDLPLAAWRVHATAAELYLQLDNSDSAEYHRQLSRATILKLANSLAPDDPLRNTFLTAHPVRKVLDDAGTVASATLAEN